jgi:uncharacterized protein (DUF362 family)/NAD-dependent dihydropyrimidine dehydrogenase PreA subunit
MTLNVVYTQGVVSQADVGHAVREFVARYGSMLPGAGDALIFIKPNLNNDLCAMTGNSTDLRLLAAVIEALQQRGYANIAIGDGPNIGTYRRGIDVFGRLGVRALAAHFGVRLLDLNREPPVEAELTTGRVRLARICLEADFFINLPKLKTHAEAGMSLALKSLIGCVVGTDKREVHANLPANIVRLNEIIRPHLHIADALVAMEGNGPGDGDPRRLDMLLAGTNPFVLDLAAAQLFGLSWQQVPALEVAHHLGHLSEEEVAAADALEPLVALEPPPPRGLLTRLLDHRALAPLRDLTRPMHSQEWVRAALHRAGIIQDVYEQTEADIEQLTLNRQACDGCGLCLAVCPTELAITAPDFDFWTSPECLRCLYCALVCPRKAIAIEGNPGYLEAHLERYGEKMRSL